MLTLLGKKNLFLRIFQILSDGRSREIGVCYVLRIKDSYLRVPEFGRASEFSGFPMKIGVSKQFLRRRDPAPHLHCILNIFSRVVSNLSGNRAGRVGFGFESDGSDQFDFLEEIGSDWVGSGQFICCVFSDR
jgi:hypothetical protein